MSQAFSTCSPGPHIIRKIALGHSSDLNCQWRVRIQVLAHIAGPDKQGALAQLKHINPHLYKTSFANRLGDRLGGIAPQFISCWCCMVRPLLLWEDHARYPALVGTDAGHSELMFCAKKFRTDTGYWPSPAWVLERLLGPPSPAAKANERLRKVTSARDSAEQQRTWSKRLAQRRAALRPGSRLASLPIAAAAATGRRTAIGSPARPPR
jgi:hypothetical protein